MVELVRPEALASSSYVWWVEGPKRHMSFQKNVLRCSFCVLPFRIDVWRDCLILNFTNGTCGISCNICNMSWFWSFCASTPPTVVVGRRMNRSRFPDFASNRTKKKSRRKVLATEMEIRFFAVRVLYQAWRCQVVAYKLNLKEMFVISNISKLSQILTFPPFVGVCFEESAHLHFA